MRKLSNVNIGKCENWERELNKINNALLCSEVIFKTTFRNLRKNKTYSFINIIGLAIGTLCCLYILLYVEDQYSYDKHHKNAEDIYRITSSVKLTGDKGQWSCGFTTRCPGHEE